MNTVLIKDLNFGYSEDNIIFASAQIDVSNKDRVCIIGENGSGKSTFLRIMSNIIPCNMKLDFFDQKNTYIKDVIGKIGYVPDKPFLYDLLTGSENAEFLMNLFAENREAFTKRFKLLAEKFNLSEYLNTRVSDFSLGMRHKLFLSAILARDISLLLLDEPLNALDKESQNIAVEEIIKKSNNGCAIIFTSHIQQIQQSLSNKLYVIHQKKFKLSEDLNYAV